MRLLVVILALSLAGCEVSLRRLLLVSGGGGSFTPLPTDYTAFYNRQVGGSTYRIYAATSTDAGESFTANDTVLIDIGSGGSWNDVHVAHVCVIPEDGAYALYASGYDGSEWHTGRWTAATLSTDPADWTPDGANPILSPGGGQTGRWVPQCQPDDVLELTRIWTLVADGTNFWTYYAERDWATGTITDYGMVLAPGGAGTWNEVGSDGGVPHEIGGEKRLYVGGQDAAGISSTGYATYTDPRDDATYTIVGQVLAGPITVTDGEFDSVAILSIQPYGASYLVWGSLIHPTGLGAGREIAFRATSTDGLTFGTPEGAVIPMATSYPSNESRENPNVHLTP